MGVDPRISKQAKILVNYSLRVKKGDRISIVSDFKAIDLVKEVYKQCILNKAKEIIVRFDECDEFKKIFFENASRGQIESFPEINMGIVKSIDCWIGIFSPFNTKALSGINAGKISKRMQVLKPLQDWRVEKTRWVVTVFPSLSLAREADMSFKDYQDFVFSSINDINWKLLGKKQQKIKKLLDKTKIVRIKDKDTDLTFDISRRKSVSCAGEFNMPDGEIFTSINEKSAEGFITFTYPAIYLGREFENVRLEFKKGKAVRASSFKNQKDLNKILDTDSGSRYLGEFGIGNNYKIKRFSKEILFDEKIKGTIHLALGAGYKETLGRNKSAIHWDMIKDLRSEGELWFDAKLVQQKGAWKI